jgi:hypothetical protein
MNREIRFPVILRFTQFLVSALIPAAVLLTAACAPPEIETVTTFQTATEDELNFARTTPSAYAEDRLLDDYHGGTDNGAYLDMKGRTQVPAVSLQDQLIRAAMDYAVFLADNNVFGHEENGTPEERCEAAGYYYFTGENLAAGNSPGLDAAVNPEEAAIEFVRILIIDAGIPDVGHRENIMAEVHRSVGIGYAQNFHSDFVNYTVQEFGSR